MSELIRGVIHNTSFRVFRTNCTFEILKPELYDDGNKSWQPLNRPVQVVYWVTFRSYSRFLTTLI